MKRNHKILAGLFAALALSGAAVAQGVRGCDGMGPMSGQAGPMGRHVSMKFDPAARAQRHLAALKEQLKLTPEQEPLWAAFAEKAKGEAGKGMRALREQGADAKLTAPERMARMQSLMQERLTAMAGVHESFNRLYAALTPEQQAVADQHAARMGRGMGARGAGPRGAMPQG